MAEPYYRQTTQQALSSQQSSANGLTEQEVAQRARQYGPNKL